MKEIFLGMFVTLLAASFIMSARKEKESEQRYIKAIEALGDAKTEMGRCYRLPEAAKLAFIQGEFEEAEKFARELLALAAGRVDLLGDSDGKFEEAENKFSRELLALTAGRIDLHGDGDGDGVHDANLVLGRLALREGNIDEAKGYLLAAGRTLGSVTLNSFGPNMSLAKDLLEQGEQEVVLEYFDLCRSFWKMDQGRLDKWVKQAKRGSIPDFGANLLF